MSITLPPSFLFRFSVPVLRDSNIPRGGGARLLNLSDEHRIVWPATLNETGVRYGDLRIAWNAAGIGFQVDVNNKRSQPRCYTSMPETSDGLQVWIDTRNTQTIHRASRYCHSFCFLPLGAGPKGLQPHATAVAIARAREEAAVAAPTGKPVVQAEVHKNGWWLDAWIPADALRGYDPLANPRLGFFCELRDNTLGSQPFGLGRDFPFAQDPSLWSTLELTH